MKIKNRLKLILHTIIKFKKYDNNINAVNIPFLNICVSLLHIYYTIINIERIFQLLPVFSCFSAVMVALALAY